MKVLVVQQRYGIGDMLIFLPYLKALSEKNNVKISLLAKKTSRSSELFKSENFLDEIIDLDSTNLSEMVARGDMGESTGFAMTTMLKSLPIPLFHQFLVLMTLWKILMQLPSI